MKKLLSIVFITVISICFLIPDAYGQTYEERRRELLRKQSQTRAEITKLDEQIKGLQRRINQTEELYDQSYKRFQNLTNLIELQDDKIQSLQNEQIQIQNEINLIEVEIEAREQELNQLIDNYKKIILYAYKKGRSSNLELLLTSASINQMMVRAYYLQRFEEQKGKQAEQIRLRKDELDDVKGDLESSHLKNSVILEEIRDEKSELNQQRERQEETVESIKNERSTVLRELRKTRQERENFNNSLSSLIEEQENLREAERERLAKLAEARKIADEQQRATEVAKYSTPIVRENFVSEETLLSYEDAFRQSKGSLPWPVNSRTISKKFGRHVNPIYGTETDHPGINIVAEPRSEVRVVADGYVFNIGPTPGYGDVVYVKHGSYYTAYGNLSDYTVQNYAVLKAGDVIGYSGDMQSPLGEVVFFYMRQGNSDLNPENWLIRR